MGQTDNGSNRQFSKTVKGRTLFQALSTRRHPMMTPPTVQGGQDVGSEQPKIVPTPLAEQASPVSRTDW